MATLRDIHGNRYHTATWHVGARTAREDQDLSGAAFDRNPNGTIKVRMVILNEARELVTEPIDVGTHLYVPQPDGRWLVESKTPEPETGKII